MGLEGLVFVVVVAATTLAPIVSAVLRSRSLARARMGLWRNAALAAGFTDAVRWADGVLSAAAADLQLRLSLIEESEDGGTRIEVWSTAGAPSLSVRNESPGLRIGRRARREVEIGDDEFDRQASIQGSPALALALLDADVRGTLSGLLRGRLEVRGHRAFRAQGSLVDGVLQVDVPSRESAALARRASGGARHDTAMDAYLDGEDKLPRLLRAVHDLAARLVTPTDVAQRIASNLASEPAAGVRRKALLTLLREFPEREATREAVDAALSDPDAEVRTRAAIALGADGRRVLLGVAGGEGADDATSARAVTALGATLDLEQASELLRSALRTRRLLTTAACLAIVGRHGEAAVPMLARVMLVEKGEIGAAAAAALAGTGTAAAEAPLVRALREDASELRRAAAIALGRVGTRDAVRPLREVEASDAALRGAARQAVAEIHARLAGAGQGQLSLAGGEAGQLSLSDDEAGRLSLSEDRGVRS